MMILVAKPDEVLIESATPSYDPVTSWSAAVVDQVYILSFFGTITTTLVVTHEPIVASVIGLTQHRRNRAPSM